MFYVGSDDNHRIWHNPCKTVGSNKKCVISKNGALKPKALPGECFRTFLGLANNARRETLCTSCRFLWCINCMLMVPVDLFNATEVVEAGSKKVMLNYYENTTGCTLLCFKLCWFWSIAVLQFFLCIPNCFEQNLKVFVRKFSWSEGLWTTNISRRFCG